MRSRRKRLQRDKRSAASARSRSSLGSPLSPIFAIILSLLWPEQTKQNPLREALLENHRRQSAKPDGVGAVSQLWTTKGERSSSLTHIGARRSTLRRPRG